MIDNNSSCYNCREVTGGGLPSIHSYGLAIDINPIQNPYIFFEEKDQCSTKILPSNGKNYINRTNTRAGMVESIVEIFKKNGFTVWGGKWNTPIDWQHFQPPRPLAQLLAVMSTKDGIEFFEKFAISNKSKIFDEVKATDNKFVELYLKSPEKFMKIFRSNKKIFSMETTKALQLFD